MITACRLNNKNMRGIRRSEDYQCVMVDLAMLGVISKEECEMLIGGSIPKNLTLPNGKQGHLISENNLPAQPVQTDGADSTQLMDSGANAGGTDGSNGADGTNGTDIDGGNPSGEDSGSEGV